MSRSLSLVILTLTGALAAPSPVHSQAPEPPSPLIRAAETLHLQLHGYASQGFVYSTSNNWNLTDSTSGSLQWTDAVLSFSSQPAPKLRIGAQGRYFRLGGVQNQLSLDWAQADYKVNEYLGFRGGKVKTPIGLLNESQDIDPAQLWVLLPQSVYNIASRNVLLSHNGGVIYGSAPLGERLGKIEYRAFGGQRSLAGDDGYLQSSRDDGFAFPVGIQGHVAGATLRWNTPLPGLLLGASEASGAFSGPLTFNEAPYGRIPGTLNIPLYRQLFFFTRYEHGRFMLAGEDSRTYANAYSNVGGFRTTVPKDQHGLYAMATVRISAKLSTGLYFSDFIDRQAAYTTFRYQKDWALAGRYDFNPWLYAKLEQHFIDGNGIGISTTDNPNLQPTNRMTMLKLGVTF